MESESKKRKRLEQELGDYGFAAETTGRRMTELLAVQNTYLSTFQCLGGLGLLLGTFGLAAMGIFLTVLVVGFVYEWRKGALEWD